MDTVDESASLVGRFRLGGGCVGGVDGYLGLSKLGLVSEDLGIAGPRFVAISDGLILEDRWSDLWVEP